MSGAIRAVDRATSFVEKPVRRLSRSGDLNPLPHAGTISVFLLGVVIVSGLYITLFFSFGHAASYDAVQAMENHAIQRVIRALHRYSSAALVLTTLVHAWRVFTSQRFTSPRRRWRWASGIAALTLVWLAGVTGYWLVWDRRAAAISETFAQLLGSFGWANDFVVSNLLGISPGSGSGFLLVLWFVHLGLSAVISWFMYRHLRRSRQAWLPPTQWMGLMGGALLVVSLALPLGMLGPARPDQLVADMPLDPFMLFLLPPLLSGLRWFALSGFVLLVLGAGLFPWLLRRSDPAPIIIDEEACTGCEICVQDCPYEALSMRFDPDVAVLDASQCVSCGICLGSCAFDAIDLPGWSAPARDVQGKHVRVVCDRHDVAEDPDGSDVVVGVSCAGMFTPNAVRGYVERGATGVELVGCAPSDCRYGLGNQLAAERLSGERAPHPPRRYSSIVSTSWTPVGELERAADESPASPDGRSLRTALTAPGLVVFVSVLAVVAATRTPFRTETDVGSVRVVIDHVAGAEIIEVEQTSAAIVGVEVTIDDVPQPRAIVSTSGGRSLDFHDWSLPIGTHDLRVELAVDDGDSIRLFESEIDVDERERFVLTAFDVPPAPGADRGREIFTSRSVGCDTCHSTIKGRDGVGPSLYGIGDVGDTRVEGLTSSQYLRQSILLPDQYIVDGWPAGQMLPIYRERLTEEDLEALLVYLDTLRLEEES